MKIARIVLLPHGEQTAALEAIHAAACDELSNLTTGPDALAVADRFWKAKRHEWGEEVIKAVAARHALSVGGVKGGATLSSRQPLTMARAHVVWMLKGLMLSETQISEIVRCDRSQVGRMSRKWDDFRCGYLRKITDEEGECVRAMTGKMSKREACRAMGVAVSRYESWERGKRGS